MASTRSRTHPHKSKTRSARVQTRGHRAPPHDDGPAQDAIQETETSAGSGPAGIDEGRRAEQIRDRAYQLYERNGCVDGRALDDWLAAEAEIVTLETASAAPHALYTDAA